jgi:hypothetical protein
VNSSDCSSAAKNSIYSKRLWLACFKHKATCRNAGWHSCCVAAWNLWTAPSDRLRHLKALQSRLCRLTGERLLKDAEVDHHVPLFAVWRDHRALAWPQLLAFWGAPNLQVVNRSAHAAKCAQESGERAQRRQLQEPATAG